MADFSAISIEEQQQKINEAVTLLVQKQFNAEIFTLLNINIAGFTANKLLEQMHILTSIKEDGKLDEVLKLSKDEFWMTPDSCELDGLLKFVNWLKTNKGMTALNNLRSKQRKPQKHDAGFTMTPEDAAWVELLKNQLECYEKAKKEVYAKYEEEINELRRRLMLKEQELQEELQKEYEATKQ